MSDSMTTRERFREYGIEAGKLSTGLDRQEQGKVDIR
jgi:hypothetical protein